MAFRRETSAFYGGDFLLKGLDADHEYQFEDADSRSIIKQKGDILMKKGFRIVIDHCRGCRLVFYKSVR
jgi:hypothetical protein